jgi:hypothetical protein
MVSWMVRLLRIPAVTGWLIGLVGASLAGVSLVQHRDGTTGIITHLGDDVGIYSDPHGNAGPVVKPGNIPSSLAPHGDTHPSLLTPFGTPVPPSNLTPPSVLPPTPNRPLMPQQPPAPLTSAPPSGFGTTGGSGRIGR